MHRNLLRIVLIAALFLSCLGSGEIAEKETITIVDAMNKSVEVPCPPERIVCLNHIVNEIISALGEGDRIVARDEYSIFPTVIKEKALVGRCTRPDIELLLEQKPDLIIAPVQYFKGGEEESIRDSNIPLVMLKPCEEENLIPSIIILGEILGQDKKAKELADYITGYQNLVQSRVARLKDEDKPRVFYESSAYRTSAKGYLAKRIAEVGGINIADDLAVGSSPTVSPEWVVEENPDIIIHWSGTTEQGSELPTAEALSKVRDEVLNRSGLSDVKAVESGKVYVISKEVTTGPRMMVGLLYFAKWINPQAFEDIDPAGIYKEVLEKFYPGEVARGTFGYPES